MTVPTASASGFPVAAIPRDATAPSQPQAFPTEVPLLRVSDLVTSFRTERGTVRAVDHVSFDLDEGATLGIVGESGCGKSVTALSVMRLVPHPQGTIESGRIELRGQNLLELSERAMQGVRGNHVSMIFQEPMTSLNPVYSVGAQIVEAIRLHQNVSRRQARAKAIAMLRLVGIPSPETNIDAYPHHLSGGMRQRVMIAMALSCEPKLLIADEPTTALDVTIQAQILELLRDLQSRLGMGIVLITHDLGVVAETCSDVIVMYAGQVVESAPAHRLFSSPQHPYTRGLLRSLPSFESTSEPVAGGPFAARPRQRQRQRQRLPIIEGIVPDLAQLSAGCRFSDRCPDVQARCRDRDPDLVKVNVKPQTPENVSEPSLKRSLPPSRREHLVRCVRAIES